MATIQSQLVCDSSTYANFSQWASAISAAFASFTWAQSTDTGQVMWSGMSLSAVSMSGNNATYTYSSLTGLALAVGRALTITGMGNAGNNGTFVITALGTGTFTVVNASGVNASSQTGVVTAQTTVPGSAAYFNEIWTPNDGLTNFYVKVEYGNYSGTNCPSVRFTLGTATNGAGTLSGITWGPVPVCENAYTAPSTTTQYECNFSGAAGRIGVMLWRNGVNNSQQFFAIERSVNSTGTYTSTYVTGYRCGYGFQGTANRSSYQGSVWFGIGTPNLYSSGAAVTNWGGFYTRFYYNGASNSSAFNNAIAFDLAAPHVGYFDYNGTVVGTANSNDIVDGVTFTATVYGATRTYLPGKTGPFQNVSPLNAVTNAALCMRFD